MKGQSCWNGLYKEKREGTDPRGDEAEHDPFVEGQRLSLLHLDPLLVETLHCVHLARVRLPASVDLAESSPSDDPVHGEVIHRQLHVQLEILPLAETGEFLTKRGKMEDGKTMETYLSRNR